LYQFFNIINQKAKKKKEKLNIFKKFPLVLIFGLLLRLFCRIVSNCPTFLRNYVSTGSAKSDVCLVVGLWQWMVFSYHQDQNLQFCIYCSLWLYQWLFVPQLLYLRIKKGAGHFCAIVPLFKKYTYNLGEL